MLKPYNSLEEIKYLFSLIKLRAPMKMSYCCFLLLQAGVKNPTLCPNFNARKNILTTLADRRRAGPPAFRRKHRKSPGATLSFPRWPSLFERILTFEEGVGAHSEPLPVVWVYTTGNCPKF